MFRVRSSTLAQFPTWISTPCRLFATVYSIHSQLPFLPGPEVLDASCHCGRDPQFLLCLPSVSIHLPFWPLTRLAAYAEAEKELCDTTDFVGLNCGCQHGAAQWICRRFEGTFRLHVHGDWIWVWIMFWNVTMWWNTHSSHYFSKHTGKKSGKWGRRHILRNVRGNSLHKTV